MFKKKKVPLTKLVPFAKTAPQCSRFPSFSVSAAKIILLCGKTVPLCKAILKRYLKGGHPLDMKMAPLGSTQPFWLNLFLSVKFFFLNQKPSDRIQVIIPTNDRDTYKHHGLPGVDYRASGENNISKLQPLLLIRVDHWRGCISKILF